jgi:DNA-binding MarR family transcriptional regulator
MSYVTSTGRVEGLLNDFAEKMSGLMIDHYQRHLAELELTLPQAQALRILRRGPLTTGRLAEELGISAPALTQLTDRMARKELIERRASEDDRRCVIVSLTPKGTFVVDECRARRSEAFSVALTGLTESEQEQVFKALELVVGALDSSVKGATVARPEVSKLTGKSVRV